MLGISISSKNMLCNYADAAANDILKEIQEQLPKWVSETVDKYMNSKSVEVKVDEASVKSVKSKITDLLSSLFR